MRRVRRLGILILAVGLLSGCIISRHPTGIAASSAPLSPNYTVLGPVEDSSCMSYLLLLPIGTMDEPDAIIARLVQERGGDALISLTVELRNSTFALPIVSSTCTIVKGIAVKNVR